MIRVLGVAGESLAGPFVSIQKIDNKFEIHLTHYVNTVRKTEILVCKREELDLIGLAIYKSMELPNDD